MAERGVSTRLSTVMLSMVAFQYALDREARQREREAMILLACLAAITLSASASAQRRVGAPSLVDALSLLLIGASLAPVFGTLTSSYAVNTVETMSNLSYLVHLYSMDNRMELPHAWASPVSMNAALASTLLQASRLKSSALSFTFSILCIALLIFVPAAAFSPKFDFFFATLACMSSFIWFGMRQALLFLALFVFASIIGPRILKSIPSVQMSGPWDLLQVPDEEEFS